MFKIFLKGTSVPKEILSFHRRSHESVLPKRVEFTRAVLITEKYGEIHVRPIYGILKANSIYIDEIGGCIVKGGINGTIIHNLPIFNLPSITIMLLIVALVLNYV
ncbi:hypothetical protein IXW83_13635 [Escherichia coli]|uniref:hypothetical protein n=1 Tax=Escherichia coli TaxID=562 RepID=UPI001832703D|nr:hypothetical protein [Escherichia coli]MBA7820381.1 hypothetical protein [Escherichia coli]MCZ0470458.1 hypothetical protein [Escherichia coli]HCN5245487.1 hypothetical protein [Escherichia coli]HDC8884091.1 hypothetical protein [Escherichia coli]